MTPREVWNQIDLMGLYKTKGKTPWASVNSEALIHSINSPVKNRKVYARKNGEVPEYFEIVDKKPMKFILSNISTIHLGIEEEDSNIEETLEKSPLYFITSKELEWKKLTVYNNNENIEYELSDCNEYTYIIEDKAHATIKIGKTKNDPELRFNQLKTANPSIKLLHVFPSEQWSESDLHQKFGDIQKDLEWFFFTKGLRIFISEEMNKHGRMLFSYEKKKELDISEKMMLDII
jgi:hypothetical protein